MELTADEKTTEFLSSVVGINLTEYTLPSPLPPSGYNTSQYPSNTYRYPPEFCGLVKEESRSFRFEADESKIHAVSTLYNGQIVFFTFEAPGGNPIYSETPANDLLSQVKTLLQ